MGLFKDRFDVVLPGDSRPHRVELVERLGKYNYRVRIFLEGKMVSETRVKHPSPSSIYIPHRHDVSVGQRSLTLEIGYAKPFKSGLAIHENGEEIFRSFDGDWSTGNALTRATDRLEPDEVEDETADEIIERTGQESIVRYFTPLIVLAVILALLYANGQSTTVAWALVVKKFVVIPLFLVMAALVVILWDMAKERFDSR